MSDIPIIPNTIKTDNDLLSVVGWYYFKLSIAYCASSGVNFSPYSEISWS